MQHRPMGHSQKIKLGRWSSPQGRFGVALFKKRIRTRLSQWELAQIFGVNRVTIARWEINKRVPSPKNPKVVKGMWVLDQLEAASNFARRKILIEHGIV